MNGGRTWVYEQKNEGFLEKPNSQYWYHWYHPIIIQWSPFFLLSSHQLPDFMRNSPRSTRFFSVQVHLHKPDFVAGWHVHVAWTSRWEKWGSYRGIHPPKQGITKDLNWLVVTGTWMDYFFHINWKFYHPNWRVVHHFSEGWLNEMAMGWHWRKMGIYGDYLHLRPFIFQL